MARKEVDKALWIWIFQIECKALSDLAQFKIIDERKQQASSYSSEKVEKEKSLRAPYSFEEGAEDEKPEHVAEKVAEVPRTM